MVQLGDEVLTGDAALDHPARALAGVSVDDRFRWRRGSFTAVAQTFVKLTRGVEAIQGPFSCPLGTLLGTFVKLTIYGNVVGLTKAARRFKPEGDPGNLDAVT